MSAFRPLEIFKELTAVPRDSGDEGAVAAYLLGFAAKNGLEALRDGANNVLIRKKGSAGRESEPALILQSHTDMVYVKDEASAHRYGEPLPIVEADGFLRSDGTSLGADNGAGCAYVLALLESDGLSHPPLEALFIAGEEIGMLGAAALDPAWLTGRRMLNLDSEKEGAFILGCAGGVTAIIRLAPEFEKAPEELAACKVGVGGLKGGHSGLDANEGRGNAIRLLSRFLFTAWETLGARAAEIQGGGKVNAIPSHAEAIVLIRDPEALRKLADRCQAVFREELSGADDDVTVTVSPCAGTADVLTEKCFHRLLFLLMNIPDGVQGMSRKLDGFVETSNNIGILTASPEFTSPAFIEIGCALRSSKVSQKEFMRNQLSLLAGLAEAGMRFEGDYPAWDCVPYSPLQEKASEVYRKLYGAEPELMVLHAGLECGYFQSLYPDMDLLSAGPNLFEVHTPRERLDIVSMERVWNWLTELLREI